jgi:hypothetical protein
MATAVIMVAAKLDPFGLWVPVRPLRKSALGRVARLAALLVGSTLSGRTNVNRAWCTSKTSRYAFPVMGTP